MRKVDQFERDKESETDKSEKSKLVKRNKGVHLECYTLCGQHWTEGLLSPFI